MFDLSKYYSYFTSTKVTNILENEPNPIPEYMSGCDSALCVAYRFKKLGDYAKKLFFTRLSDVFKSSFGVDFENYGSIVCNPYTFKVEESLHYINFRYTSYNTGLYLIEEFEYFPFNYSAVYDKSMVCYSYTAGVEVYYGIRTITGMKYSYPLFYTFDIFDLKPREDILIVDEMNRIFFFLR